MSRTNKKFVMPLVVIISLFLLFFNFSFAQAKVFTQDNSLIEDTKEIPEPLQPYNGVGKQIKDFLIQCWHKWQSVQQKALHFLNEKTQPLVQLFTQSSHLENIKNNIEKSLLEEREEWSHTLFGFLGKAWQQTKDKLKILK